jgi:lysophospholipase L1-like esterase
MKHTALLIAAALLCAAVLALTLAWRRQAEPDKVAPKAYSPRGPGDVYLSLGDSLATGLRLADPARESYVALLAAQLEPLGTSRHLNLAVAGATSGSLLERQVPEALARIEQFRTEGLRVSPISLDIGGNDLRAVEQAPDPEREQALASLARNLSDALDRLREAAPDADLVVMTYYDPYGGDPGVPNSDAAWVARLNTTIREAAERRGVAVADVYAAFGGGLSYQYTNILLGDVHANRQGHAVIAEQYWRALQYVQPVRSSNSYRDGVAGAVRPLSRRAGEGAGG